MVFTELLDKRQELISVRLDVALSFLDVIDLFHDSADVLLVYKTALYVRFNKTILFRILSLLLLEVG